MCPKIACWYGSVYSSEHILLPLETMLEYEMETGVPEVHNVKGRFADIPMRAFCSDYTENVAQALLLRDWAVEYHNRLLAVAASAPGN